MDSRLFDEEIEYALEALAGVILGIDTVAILNIDSNLYGVYVKSDDTYMDEPIWYLKFTTLTLDGLLEKN